MPLLQIRTNAEPLMPERRELVAEASRTVAKMVGKPEKYVMVDLSVAQTMSFGGSDEPLCLMTLRSLGLQEDQTAEFSRVLTDLIATHLRISPGRVYIEFASPPRHMWGYNGGTFG
jgi:phenylpyruvate tautomerase